MIRLKDLLLEIDVTKFGGSQLEAKIKKDNLLKLIKKAPNSEEILIAFQNAFDEDHHDPNADEKALIEAFIDEVEKSGIEDEIMEAFEAMMEALVGPAIAGIAKMDVTKLPTSVRKKLGSGISDLGINWDKLIGGLDL